MAWATQIAATFIAAILMMFILWLIYKGFKIAFSKLKLKFSKKLDDDEIEFLNGCLENNVSNDDLLKVLLTHNPKVKKRAMEMIYFYNKMKREVKKHE